METNNIKKVVAGAIIATGMAVGGANAENINTNEEIQAKRTKCEIYTRVMGYFRPVSQFNTGKKGEFYSREYFKEDISCNSKFISDYKN